MRKKEPVVVKQTATPVEILEREKKIAQNIFSSIAHAFEAKMIETGLYVPLDYTFRNPDVSCVLEKRSSCEKYEAVYGINCDKRLLVSELLPEADAYSSDENEWVKPIKIVDVIGRFLGDQEISYIAVLKGVYYNNKQKNYHQLFVYHFDKQKFNVQRKIERERELALLILKK